MSSKMKAVIGVVGRGDVFKIDPSALHIRKDWNPRKSLEIEELVAYIRDNGTRSLPPIRVIRQQDALTVVDGERRVRAALAAAEETGNASMLYGMLEGGKPGETSLLYLALGSNQGLPLQPLEEAAAFQRLIDAGETVTSIAQRLGKSKGFVSDRLKLLQLPETTRAEVEAGTTSLRKAVDSVRPTHRAKPECRPEPEPDPEPAPAPAGRGARAEQSPLQRVLWSVCQTAGVAQARATVLALLDQYEEEHGA